jgi:hypothetical protein
MYQIARRGWQKTEVWAKIVFVLAMIFFCGLWGLTIFGLAIRKLDDQTGSAVIGITMIGYVLPVVIGTVVKYSNGPFEKQPQ